MASSLSNMARVSILNDGGGKSVYAIDNERGIQDPDIGQALLVRRLEEMQSWIRALQDSQKKDQEEQERLKHMCDKLEQKVQDDAETRAMESCAAEQTRKRLEDELEKAQEKSLGLEEDLKIRTMEAFEAEQRRKQLEEELEKAKKRAVGLEGDLKIRELEALSGYPKVLPRRAHTPDRFFRSRYQRVVTPSYA